MEAWHLNFIRMLVASMFGRARITWETLTGAATCDPAPLHHMQQRKFLWQQWGFGRKSLWL